MQNKERVRAGMVALNTRRQTATGNYGAHDIPVTRCASGLSITDMWSLTEVSFPQESARQSTITEWCVLGNLIQML